jgi:hypothetical protein
LTATATCDGFFREIVHVAVAVNDHVNVNDHVHVTTTSTAERRLAGEGQTSTACVRETPTSRFANADFAGRADDFAPPPLAKRARRIA